MLVKTFFIFIIVYFFGDGVSAFENTDNDLRKELFALNSNSMLAYGLLEKLDKIENTSFLIYAYRGVCEAHIAKVISNPFEKFYYMLKANRNLSKAVNMNKNNVEVRFLRYAVQIQTPKLLGFQKNIEEDRQIIMSDFTTYDWSRIDKNIINYICYFIIDTGECTDIEKQQLLDFLDKENLAQLPVK